MKTTVSEAIARTLKAYETEYFFLVTGGDMDLWYSLQDAEIKFAPARSESAAVYMADGYSRISWKPSFVYGQSGPGAANVSAALAEPFWGSSPVVAITSSTRSSSKYKYEYQEIEQLALFQPVTKWNGYLTDPPSAPHHLRAAIRAAVSGCPGPSHLDIPNDLWNAEIQIPEIYADRECKSYPAFRSSAEESKLSEAAELLIGAERPLLVAGNGVIISRAWEEVVALSELLSIPVATSLNGKGSIPEGHRFAVGAVGRYGRKSTNDIARMSDLVMFIGCKTGGLVTDTFTVPKQAAKIIHVDVDPQVFGVNYKTDLCILGDAKLVLAALLSEIRRKAMPLAPKEVWLNEVRGISSSWRREFERAASDESSPLKQYRVIKILREVLGKEDIVVADTGYAAAWAGALFEVYSPGRSFTRAAGSLGWAFPAAIGAKLAAPKRNVVCITGDGGMGYHLTELESAVRLKIPVVVLVLNNNSLSFEYHVQKFLYGRVINEINDFCNIDFGKIAMNFGGYGERIERGSDLRSGITRAIESGKPAVLDLLVSKEEPAPVSVYESSQSRTI